jgi:tRNA (guanine37-N1)-methyltransferase
MRVDVFTIFPEMVRGFAAQSLLGRAQERGALDVRVHDLRDQAHDPHRTVDDAPFGGGAGMVLMAEPVFAAVEAVAPPRPLLYLSPAGRRLDQGWARELAAGEGFSLLCGRYEGVDERFLRHEVDEEISIGDYVLSGGELPAAVLIDAIGRLQEGALNDADSARQDSFSDGPLDCPHYTRPERHELGAVPAVLMSGDHAAMARWRRKQALGRTWQRRPELLAKLKLNREDEKLLIEFQQDTKF